MTRRDAVLALMWSCGVVLLLAWPLPRFLGTHLYMPLMDPDVQCGLWWPDAFVGSVLALEDPFFRPELAWPVGQDVRLLIWNFFLQILFFPVYALLDPVSSLNVVALLVAVLNGLACGWAGWKATEDRQGALAALLVGAGTLFGFFECLNGRPEQGFWAPLVIYAGAWFGVLRGERRMAWVAGAALAIAGATYWFYAIFGLLGTLPLAAWMLWRRRWRPLVEAGVASLIVVLPFLLPVALGLGAEDSAYTVLRDTMDTTAQQTRASLAFPNELFGALLQGSGAPSTQLPLVVLPSALLGLFFRDCRALALGALAFAVLALGPMLVDGQSVPFADRELWLPHVLLNELPGFTRFWWPYRWIAPALALTALVVARLVRRAPSWTIWVVVAVVLVDAKAILKRSGASLHAAEVPASVLALAEREEVVPVAAYPPRVVENGLVGLQPFHRQPIDAGLAWNETPELRGGWEERAEGALIGGLSMLQAGQHPPYEADFGDFGAVVAFVPRALPREQQRLEAWLGPATEVSGPWMVWIR